MRRYGETQKLPSIRVIEEDVDHRAFLLTDLAAVRPEFHAEKQRHSSVPRILEGEIKVPAAANVERPRRNEEDIIHSFHKGLAINPPIKLRIVIGIIFCFNLVNLMISFILFTLQTCIGSRDPCADKRSGRVSN